jgi:XRE family aerobic/anaerobic benzoate catabolism transcriptional regulator
MGARDAAAAVAGDGEFLAQLGARVRQARERRGLTRRALSDASRVSERHLAGLEAGHGNMSVLLLRQVADSLGVPVAALLQDHGGDDLELHLIVEFLQRLPRHRLARVHAQLQRDFGDGAADRSGRIALLGLRGAGKSTLGEALAAELKLPFIELDREIERDAGTSLPEVFLLYGQEGYRRYERRCLERILAAHPRCVIATGGSIVSEPATYDLLRSSCFTVWLKAKPEEHMARVIAQGDTRPMAGNAQAMGDLKRILQSRAPLYGEADATVDTAGRSVKQSLKDLRRALSA